MSNHVPEGRLVRCDRCGASLGVPSLAPAIRSPACGHVQPMPPGLVQELQNYERAVQIELQRAHADGFSASLHDPSLGLFAPSPAVVAKARRAATVTVATCAPLLIGLGVAGLWLPDAPWSLSARNYVLLIVFMAAALSGMAGVVAYGIVVATPGQRRERQAALQALRPNCGAPQALRPGQTLDTCGHCRASAVPSAGLMERGMAVAQHDARLARLRRLRVERQGCVKVPGGGVDRTGIWVSVGMLGLLALVVVFLMGVGTWPMVAGGIRFHPAILLGWAVACAAVAAPIVTMRRQLRRLAHWQVAMNNLAVQLGTQPGQSLGRTIAWLNAYWASPYDPLHLRAGAYYGNVVFGHGPYCGLIDVNLTDDEDCRARIHVLIAADCPGTVATGSPPAFSARSRSSGQ